jgi:hypothetical protein
MPQPGPPPQLALKQMELTADAQKFQATSQHEKELEMVRAQAKLAETQGNLQLQAANDQRDAERELLVAQHNRELEGMRLQLDDLMNQRDNQTRIQVALINQQGRAQAAAVSAAQKHEQAEAKTQEAPAQ